MWRADAHYRWRRHVGNWVFLKWEKSEFDVAAALRSVAYFCGGICDLCAFVDWEKYRIRIFGYFSFYKTTMI